jgi:2-isopropylmalate synthase
MVLKHRVLIFQLMIKRKVSNSLDALGVDYIEGGWPGANPTGY